DPRRGATESLRSMHCFLTDLLLDWARLEGRFAVVFDVHTELDPLAVVARDQRLARLLQGLLELFVGEALGLFSALGLGCHEVLVDLPPLRHLSAARAAGIAGLGRGAWPRWRLRARPRWRAACSSLVRRRRSRRRDGR